MRRAVGCEVRIGSGVADIDADVSAFCPCASDVMCDVGHVRAYVCVRVCSLLCGSC